MSAPIQGYFDPRGVPFFARNPSSEEAQFSQNNVAPHGDTLRATYTVPASRLAKIGFIQGFIFRRTVAGVIDNVEVVYQSDIRGTLEMIKFRNNTLGATQRVSDSGDFLESGEAITINTEDDSTGGAMDYDLIMSVTEFDEPTV